MKKLGLILMLLLTSFSLTACGLFELVDDLLEDDLFEDEIPIDDDTNDDDIDETEYFTLTVTSNESNATIHYEALNSYEQNTVVVITAETLEGFRFSHWLDLDTGTQISNQNPLSLTITKDTRVSAIYYGIEYFDINLVSTVDADLSVSAEAPFLSFMLYTITAEEKPGYVFEHWIDLDTGLIVSLEESFNFTLNRHRSFEAVYVESGLISLYTYSNVEATFDFSQEAPFEVGSTVTVTASSNSDTRFLHWLDAHSMTVLGETSEITLTLDDTAYLIAVFEVMDEARLYYDEGFEDVTKGRYDSEEVILYGKHWWFEDALIGSLANDQKNGDRSVRIRDGFIETLFTVTELSSLSFQYGHYLADNPGTLEFYMIIDEQDSILIETLATTNTLQTYTLIFDESFYETHNLDETSQLRFKLVNTGNSRTNIDDFMMYRYRFITPNIPEIFAEGDDLEFPNNSTRVSLTFDEDFVWAYSYNDVWTGEGCIAIDIELGELSCEIDGSVDTSQLGEYTITYYVLDEDGNYASETITKVVLRDASLLEFTYSSYYQGIEGLYGEALIEALREILNDGVTLMTYNDAREILADADVDPNDSSKVITIYSRDSVDRVWDAMSWHREHVWPNSRLGIPRTTGSQRNVGSDLHNLRAIVPSINSSRSNKVFSSETTTDTYYPGDLDKGDVARILFYMVVMWDHLTLVDDVLVNDPNTNYTMDGAQMALLSYLIEWHFEDPVDAFETHRNNIIFDYQNNRNPFIDYPHLVELIWFDHQSIPLD